MAPPGEKRSKDRAPSGPKKVKNRDGPNIGTQNAPDTSVLGDQAEGSRRQEGSKKNTNAIADMPRRRHYQVVSVNRHRKVISAKILEDFPETTYVDTAMDVCSAPSVAESDTYMGDVDDESNDEPGLSPA
ncbi:hypothetical protein CLIM01_06899 [Colletotrichum limetticola]|uniref:Uncharacterized protein n=1 Tax=Colletotrichum limetticola TaxID=1209924 RepID=A0ABQ9PW42_9PEZI|nr:hypothetical protein CLIM01_06899 [Colletotrichum limetticola]